MNVRLTIPLLLALLLGAASNSAAEISREDLKKALEANPDLVLSALRKADKATLFNLVVAGQQEANQKKAAEEAKLEDEEREKAIKNPLKPEIGPDARVRGKADAPITIVEYSDFECPYCSKGYQNLEQLRKKLGDDVRVVFKNKPLDFHPQAMPAAQWFEAIALQSPDKAWAFHDTLFEHQDKLGADYFKALAKDLGIDVAKAEQDAKGEVVRKKIEADMREAKKFGMDGTPGYLINGVPLRGAYPVAAFEKIIARVKAK